MGSFNRKMPAPMSNMPNVRTPIQSTASSLSYMNQRPVAQSNPNKLATALMQTPASTPVSSASSDFNSQWAQNVGGQFKDPYQNYLMTKGSSADIPSLLSQYQAAGNKGTPDWAVLGKDINQLPTLASKWDASGATPVPYLKAWNSTTPTTDKAPQGYWGDMLAYNSGASKANPQLAIANGTYQYNGPDPLHTYIRPIR